MLKRVEKLATDISGIRRRAALDFSSGVTEILHKLNMSNAEFFASISERKMSLTGIDEVDFLISSNLGIKAHSQFIELLLVVSFSRIMLAIKSVQNVSEISL